MFVKFYQRADGPSEDRTRDLERLVRDAELALRQETGSPCTVVMKYSKKELDTPRSVLNVGCGIFYAPHLSTSPETAMVIHIHNP